MMISRWWFSSIWNCQSLKFFIFNCYYSILELCIFMYCSLDSGCMLAYKDRMNKAAPSENWTICPVPQKTAFPVWHPSAILNLHACLSSSSIVPQYFCCPVVSCGLQHIPANKWLSSNLTWNLESLGFSSRAALVNLVADGVVYVSGLGVRAQVLKNIVHLAWYQYDSIGHRLGWKKAIITFYSIFFFTKYQPNYRLLCSHALQDQHLWLVIGPMFIMTSSAHCLDLNFHHYCWQLCVPFYQMFLVSFDSWTHGIWGTLYRNCNFFWMQEHFSLHCLLSDTCDTNARITYCSKSIQYSVYRSVIGYFQ